MKYVLIALLFMGTCYAQVDIPTGAMLREKTIRFDTLTVDSANVVSLQTGEVLAGIWYLVDSTVTGSAGDSVKIGIGGERPITPFRFGDFKYDSIPQSRLMMLSHTENRLEVAGALYSYEDAVAIVCTDAETYYPVQSFRPFPRNDMEVTTDGAMKVRPYRDGWYEVSVSISFASNKANVSMHCELFRNGQPYDYISFERTITNVNSAGNASLTGDIYLQGGDTLKVYVKSDTPSTTFTIAHAQFTLNRMIDGQPYCATKPETIRLYSRATGGQVRVIVETRRL